jgi:hypothetical protein
MGMRSPISTTTTGRAAAAAAALALVAGAGLVLTPAAQASTTVSGEVTCVDELPVEGVWIQASGGSGWANWTPTSGANYNARFSRGGVSGSWTVHVGCGGSSSRWKYSPDGSTTTTKSVASWTCYTPDDGAAVNFCQHTCRLPARPRDFASLFHQEILEVNPGRPVFRDGQLVGDKQVGPSETAHPYR